MVKKGQKSTFWGQKSDFRPKSREIGPFLGSKIGFFGHFWSKSGKLVIFGQKIDFWTKKSSGGPFFEDFGGYIIVISNLMVLCR